MTDGQEGLLTVIAGVITALVSVGLSLGIVYLVLLLIKKMFF